ncbi:uncharacterized protein LOC142224101 [Haematobia irritans]|uniref:uncharacterized protein LOC142224101 n=1 Tax=Haematobia irritans TaxID=7368 RepID=UPI003F4F74A8
MKMSVLLILSLLAMSEQFPVVEADDGTDDNLTVLYAEHLRASLWSMEVYEMVEEYLNSLKTWTLDNKSKLRKTGIDWDQYSDLEEAIVTATELLEALILNFNGPYTCKQQIALHASLENIFSILSKLRDPDLMTQWNQIHKGFETNMRVILVENRLKFFSYLDDEVRFLVENKDVDIQIKNAYLSDWHKRFTQHYYLFDMLKVENIRSFLPKSPMMPTECNDDEEE